MKFTAEIDVLPLKEILDPQGKAVRQGLERIGYSSVQDVRVGKHIMLVIEAASKEEAYKIAEECSKKLLANLFVEDYTGRII